MKEQIKTPEELNKMETSNVLDAEFKTLGIKMYPKHWVQPTGGKSR